MGCPTCTGATSSRGAKGDQGNAGVFGGYSGEWIFDSTITASPLATKLRLNSATMASVTEVYISDTNTDSLDYDLFLDAFSNNSNFGYIRIFKKSDNTKFWMGEVTSVTDNGTDHTFVVTYILANSTFTALDAVVATFSPKGPQGSEVLHNNMTPATAAGAIATLQTYTLPTNKLSTNGSYLEVVGLFSATTTALSAYPNTKSVSARIDGVVAHAKILLFPMDLRASSKLIMRVTRQSTTTVYIDFKYSCTDAFYFDSSGGATFMETGFSVSDLTANTIAIDLRGQYGVTYEQMVVTYFKK